MTQRSPYSDRYKTEQKGKTRRSASAAKPKRAVADLSSYDAPKKKSSSQKPTSAWGRAKAAWKSSGETSSVAKRIESTPRIKELRRIWWGLWGGALLVAVVILLMQQAGMRDSVFIPVLWVLWLAAMGGAFFLEFGPIRNERARAIAAATASGKTGKADKPEKGGKGGKPATKAPVIDAPSAPGPDDRQPPSPDDQA
jgi:hypothetical protein